MSVKEKKNKKKKMLPAVKKIANKIIARFLWRVERVIILFCYSICNSSIYILVFNIFVTFTILILSF